MDKIYTFTTFDRRYPPPSSVWRHRTWGWHETAEEAKEVVLANSLDMFEGWTNGWAVIEEVAKGDFAMCEVVQWYEAIHVGPGPNDYEVRPCAEPEWAVGVVNWSMG